MGWQPMRSKLTTNYPGDLIMSKTTTLSYPTIVHKKSDTTSQFPGYLKGRRENHKHDLIKGDHATNQRKLSG